MGSATVSMSVSLELRKPLGRRVMLQNQNSVLTTKSLTDTYWAKGSLRMETPESFCRILDLKIETGEPSLLHAGFDKRSSLSLDRRVPTSSSGGHSLIGELDRSTT